MIGIIIGLVILLTNAFFLYCCCRVAGEADRREEEMCGECEKSDE